MPYNNLTSRIDAGALIPEEVSNAMLATATSQSAVLQTFRRIPVSRAQVRFPVLSALPIAYWVGGDVGLKQTTEIAWQNKYLNIEEIAAIVPVPEAVIADIDANIWDQVLPYLTEAVGRVLDEAVFFGVNAPASFPTNVNAAAVAAGNLVPNLPAVPVAATGGAYGELDTAFGLVEADGYDVSAVVANRTLRGRLRASREAGGQLLDPGRANSSLTEVGGVPIVYPMRGLFPTGVDSTFALVGDFSGFVVAVRQDITLKILTEGVIQDAAGVIQFNLAQQDLAALRLVFRVGWQVSNPINYDQPVEANRYPVAALQIA